MMFFYYKMTPLGRWTPIKSLTYPGKKAEGRTPKRSNVIELKGEEKDWSLHDLETAYPCDDEGTIHAGA